MSWKCKGLQTSRNRTGSTNKQHQWCMVCCAPERFPMYWMCQRQKSSLTHKSTQTTTPPMWIMLPAWNGLDTEAGMLSGISRKHSLRSSFYWFTEFCNSQCLSQFAAPFIVVRAETSIAESCKKKKWWDTSNCKGIKKTENGDGQNKKEVTSTHPAQPPLNFCTRVSMQSPSLHKGSHQTFTVVIG